MGDFILVFAALGTVGVFAWALLSGRMDRCIDIDVNDLSDDETHKRF